MNILHEKISDILKQSYARLVTPEEDGTFFAEIREFPGCIASGSTADEALKNLEDVASSWLEGMIESGQSIPQPIELPDYSGKFLVRMPKSLHAKIAACALRDGVSLNHFVVTSISHYVGYLENKQPHDFYSVWEKQLATSVWGGTVLQSNTASRHTHIFLQHGRELNTPTSEYTTVCLSEAAESLSRPQGKLSYASS